MAYSRIVKNSHYAYDSKNKYLGVIGKKDELTKPEADKIADEWEKRLNPQLPKKKYDVIYADPPWRKKYKKQRVGKRHVTSFPFGLIAC